MEETLHLILQEIKGINGKVENLDTKLDNLTSELRSNFKFTNNKLDEHRDVFEVVTSEMASVKVGIEYLSSKTGRHDTELSIIMNKLRG